MSIAFLLHIIALICFICATAGVSAGRINLIAAGLAFWLLGDMTGGVVLH